MDANSIACLNELSHLHGLTRTLSSLELPGTEVQSVAEFSSVDVEERKKGRKEKRKDGRAEERVSVINETLNKIEVEFLFNNDSPPYSRKSE